MENEKTTILRKIYNHSPAGIQKLEERLYNIFEKGRLNERTIEGLKCYKFLQESQWWPKEKLEEYQMQQLSKILHHAYKSVPYYRRVFDERGLKPKDIQNFNDLRKLPFLTRDNVRNNLEDLIARNIPKSLMYEVATSGTSGKPVKFYTLRGRTHSYKKPAFMRLGIDIRARNWIGLSNQPKAVIMKNRPARKVENGKSSLWRYEDNELILSVFHMTEENLFKYVEKIEEFEPETILAYPSAIDILARFIKRNDLKVNVKGNIKAIATAAEILFPEQRAMIEDTFKCKVFDRYGNLENTLRFEECEKREGYHESMEFGYAEILNKDGYPVTKEGECGEVVSTGFTNYAMPFIRYKTEDLVEYTSHNCSCGRQLRLIKRIIGRRREFFVTKRGNLIPITFHFICGIYGLEPGGLENVKQFRFYQDTPGKVILNIVKMDSYTEKDSAQIIQGLQKRLKGQLDVEIRFVDGLSRHSGGKYIYLEQKLPIKAGGG